MESCDDQVLCTEVGDLLIDLSYSLLVTARSVLHGFDLPYQHSEQFHLVFFQLYDHIGEGFVYHVLSDSAVIAVGSTRRSACASPVGCTSCDDPSEAPSAFGASYFG